MSSAEDLSHAEARVNATLNRVGVMIHEGKEVGTGVRVLLDAVNREFHRAQRQSAEELQRGTAGLLGKLPWTSRQHSFA